MRVIWRFRYLLVGRDAHVLPGQKNVAPVLGLPRQCECRIEVCLQRFISRFSTVSQTIDATLAKSKVRSLETYRASA